MAIKSFMRGNFEHFWSSFTKISTSGSPICPIDRCVILYDMFQTMCGTKKPVARRLVLSTDPDMAVKSHARGIFKLFCLLSQKLVLVALHLAIRLLRDNI